MALDANFTVYAERLQQEQRLTFAMSRAAATAAIRKINPADPLSWEFCAFSQNNEDGIIDYLLCRLRSSNRYFVEIGASDGIENNTAWLAFGRRFSGIMIEGDESAFKTLRSFFPSSKWNLGVKTIHKFFSRDDAPFLREECLFQDPDVLSLDIDGVDYFVMKSILETGLRPKILVVEYNSVFGPDNAVTIQYREDFDWAIAHETKLYYGASIAAWKCLLTQFGYAFVSVESNGVNAVFVRSDVVDERFLNDLKGEPFRENFYQRRKFGTSWEEQFNLIRNKPLIRV
jgi:hypothetical protein